MSDFTPTFKGKPIPYTVFIGVFFLTLLMLQAIFLYYFFIMTPEAFMQYFLSVIIFFTIGILIGVFMLIYPYVKRSFDIHSVVLITLSIAIFMNFILLFLDYYLSEVHVFGITLLGLWHIISLGIIFVIWGYVLEVEFEWNQDKHVKTTTDKNNNTNPDK